MIFPDPMPLPDCGHCEQTKLLAKSFEGIHHETVEILSVVNTLVKTQQVMNDALVRLADLIGKEPVHGND